MEKPLVVVSSGGLTAGGGDACATGFSGTVAGSETTDDFFRKTNVPAMDATTTPRTMIPKTIGRRDFSTAVGNIAGNSTGFPQCGHAMVCPPALAGNSIC